MTTTRPRQPGAVSTLDLLAALATPGYDWTEALGEDDLTTITRAVSRGKGSHPHDGLTLTDQGSALLARLQPDA
jgi:hypothetical protein